MKKLCGLRGSSAPGTCNEYVDAAVKKDKRLHKQVPLFLAFGDLGYLYLKRESELVEAAKKKKVDEYLLNGEKKLRPIMQQDAKVLRLLFEL